MYTEELACQLIYLKYLVNNNHIGGRVCEDHKNIRRYCADCLLRDKTIIEKQQIAAFVDLYNSKIV